MLMYVQNMKFRRNRFLGIPNVVCIGKTKCTSIIDPNGGYVIMVYCTLSINWSDSIRLRQLVESLRVNNKLVFSFQTIFF